MKKLAIIIVTALSIVFSGCSTGTDQKINLDDVGSNVTIWENSAGEKNIVLAFEVSNSNNHTLYFKESEFDIVDENGTLIDTMDAVNAYPAVVEAGNTAVYYSAKTSDKISDVNIKLKAISHIEVEKSKVSSKDFAIINSAKGGSAIATGTLKNLSSRNTYSNVHIATITRKSNNEVVLVMTATITSIKPQEEVEFIVKDCLEQRQVSPSVVTTYQSYVYVDPPMPK
jgi:hypothetical protein